MEKDFLFERRHGKKYEDVIFACNNSGSMVKAAESLQIPYKTFIRIAKKLGCYKPNQGGKGYIKQSPSSKIDIKDILEGNHPQYLSSKLRIRLLKEGFKSHQCEICGITEWNGKPAPLELDHINGNNSDHRLENLRVICPNCHHQTETHSCKKSSLK